MTILVCKSKLLITKKGKREGTTHVAHKIKPFVVAVKFDLENKTKQIAIIIKVNGSIFFCKDKIKNLILSLRSSMFFYSC